MNKVEIGLLLVFVTVILYIGCLCYYEIVVTLENHPEIKEIGGPPVMTDLRLVAVIVGVAAIMCGIVLKLKPKEDEEK